MLRRRLTSLAIAAAFGSVVLAGSALAAGSGSPVATSSGGGIKCKGGTPGATAKGPECAPKVRARDMRKAVAAAVPATLSPAGSQGSHSYGPESLHQIGACGRNLALHRGDLGGCKVSKKRTSCLAGGSGGTTCGTTYTCDRFVVTYPQKGKLPGQSPDGPPGGGSILTTVPFKKKWDLRVYNYSPDSEPLPECVVVF